MSVMLTMLRPTYVFSTTKFVEWSSHDSVESERFTRSWTSGPCKNVYEDFIHGSRGKFGDVLNCLLEKTGEVQKATIASAQVVMGLIPTLFATVGNIVAEVSLLVSQRPLLSLLLTLGAPSMHGS